MKTKTFVAAFCCLLGSSLCFPTRVVAVLPNPSTPYASLTKKPKIKKVKKSMNADIHIASGKDSVRTTYFSLGLMATPRELSGLAVNVVGTAVQDDVNGIQVSGLLNVAGDQANGLQLAGIANVSGQNANGLQLAGLMNITDNAANGVQAAGLMNVNCESANGLIVGGLINIAGEHSNGVLVSGLANITARRANGLQMSGLMNVTGDRMQGVQISSLLNVSGHRTRGIQLALLSNVSTHMNGAQLALANICPTTIRGIQGGAFNYSNGIDGLQIGAYNHCDSTGRGLQVGLVNYSRLRKVGQIGLVNLHPDTRIQWMVYGGNIGKINTAARFLNRHTYTILGFGTHFAGLDKKFTAGFTYRAGLHQPLCSRLRLSEDLGYVHIENFHQKGEGIPARMYALQGRLNLEYAIASKLAVFASGGYNLTRHYGKAGNAAHKPIAEWGIILF